MKQGNNETTDVSYFYNNFKVIYFLHVINYIYCTDQIDENNIK